MHTYIHTCIHTYKYSNFANVCVSLIVIFFKTTRGYQNKLNEIARARCFKFFR